MNVRAKFKLIEIREHYWNPDVRTFVFQPQYDTRIEEDKRFYDATPSGQCEMMVNNPKVRETFKLGDDYYLDFSPVPAEPV